MARLVLQIPGARSLKDRRRVVKSFKDRARARLPVSVAEIGDLERYQVATLGVATVSNDQARCSEALSSVARLANQLNDAVLADVATEITSFGAAGSGIRGGIEKLFDSEEPSDFDDEDGEMDADEDRGGRR